MHKISNGLEGLDEMTRTD